jgi:hypothetical protein
MQTAEDASVERAGQEEIMTQAMATTASRMVWYLRLLLTLAVALVLGVTLADSVDATKKGNNTIASVKERIQVQRDQCELLGGGELDVRRGKGGTRFTYCEGGSHGGTSCKHTEEATQCKCETTGKNGWCTQTVTAPPHSGVVVPPPEGALDDPTGGGGGPNAGGGATVPPPSEANPGDGESQPAAPVVTDPAAPSAQPNVVTPDDDQNHGKRKGKHGSKGKKDGKVRKK